MKDLARRVLLLGVERIAERALLGLVMSRKRPVNKARRGIEPTSPIRVEDEWLVAADPLHLLGVGTRLIVRLLGRREVRGVSETRPLALLRVPPHVALAF